MKKTLLSIGLACIATLAHGAGALWASQSFLNGQTLWITNNTTVTNPGYYNFINHFASGDNGNWFITLSGANVQSGLTNTVLSTNGTTVITNLITLLPYWSAFPNPIIPSNNNGDAQNNAAIWVAMDYTNILLGPNQNTFPTQYATPTNYISPGNSNVNVVTFYFALGANSAYGDSYMNYDTFNTNDFFSFAVTNQGAAGVTYRYQLPTQFTTGANRIMFWKATVSNISTNTPGIQLNQLWLGSFGNAQ
jgi:hypothetical protein